MPNGGTLRVRLRQLRLPLRRSTPVIPDLQPGEYIRIKIRDEGVGIPEDYLKRIFDPYFTTKAKGNGLGLATTYSIIKNHNGLITVESEVHFGTTFTLYLPASPPHRSPSRSAHRRQSRRHRHRPHLDRRRRRSHPRPRRIHPRTPRLQVSGTETALEGVNLYREKLEAGERFDLVILDLTLPGGMGGKEALKHLIEIDPTVNAIVSSGYAMDSTMARYQDFGFRGVIAKPYEASELGRTVHEVIEAGRVN